MKKVFPIILALCLCFAETKAQLLTFRSTYPNITISSVSQTHDLGYIIAGYSTTYSIGSKDIVMIKTDSTGAVIWTRTFGNRVNSGADDVAANAVEIPGGTGYYLAGQFWNQGNNTYEVYVLKTDAGGNRVWSKTMYNHGYDKGMRVDNVTGGGCQVTGWLGNSSEGYLSRLDTNGNIVWQNMINYSTGAWILQSGRQTPDGGAISGGYDNELGSYEMWLLKTNAGGAIQWQHGYSMSGTYNFCYDVCHTSDNGYLLAGGSNGLNLAKTDSSGNVQWSKTYLGTGAYPRGYSVIQCRDTGYIVLANDVGNNQYLMKTDSSGNVMWTMEYTGGYFINTVEQTSDGGYVLAMGTDVIKTDANGVTGCGDVPFTLSASALPLITRTPAAYNTPESASIAAADSSTNPSITVITCSPTSAVNMASESNILIFPNPATKELKIQDSGFRMTSIEVYDMVGEKVFSQPQTSSIDVSELPPGIYFVRILSENESVTKKITVLK